MSTIVIDKKVVVDDWGLPYDWSWEEDGIKVLEDTISGHSRWAVSHKLIVQIGGKFYRTYYSTGATEYQDERPWQDDDTVTFTEIHKVPKTIEVWEDV